MQGDYDGALEGFEMVLDGQPDTYEALAGAGKALVELDRPTEAEEYLKRAYDLNRNRVEACLAMAVLMQKSGDYNGALVWAKRALLAEPVSHEARKEMERANEAKRRKLTHFVPE
jgi:tetratricopeptide (TPR) repeat protein